jgi:hypothetical protein
VRLENHEQDHPLSATCTLMSPASEVCCLIHIVRLPFGKLSCYAEECSRSPESSVFFGDYQQEFNGEPALSGQLILTLSQVWYYLSKSMIRKL